MIRYQEDPPEDAHEDGQDPKSKEEKNQWKKAKVASRHRTSGQDPGHPVPGDLHGQPSTEETTVTGHPASSPDIRPPPEIRPKSRTSGTGVQGAQKLALSARTSGDRPGHPAPPEAADIRPL